MQADDEYLHDEIEITDIPREGKKSRRPNRQKHFHPAIRNSIFSALLVLLVAVFAFISMPSLPSQLVRFISASGSSATTAGTLAYTQAISVSGNKAVTILKSGRFRVLAKPMPASCPASGAGDNTSSRTAFWITGFDAGNRRIHLAPLNDLRHALPGWLLPLHINYTVPLTLTISSAIEGLPPSFLMADSEALSPTLALPFSGQGVPGSSTVHILLPGAGCYLLRASWSHGSRLVAFAAGA